MNLTSTHDSGCFEVAAPGDRVVAVTPHLATRASRRGVLGGILLGVTATACELDPPRDDPADAAPTATEGTPGPVVDHDTRLVRQAVAAHGAALAVVSGIASARPPLARTVAPWRDLHLAHLEALEALEARVRVPPQRQRGSATALRTRLRRQEEGLQRELADASVAAESGALASLLATMSAAVAQQLAAGDVRSVP